LRKYKQAIADKENALGQAQYQKQLEIHASILKALEASHKSIEAELGQK